MESQEREKVLKDLASMGATMDVGPKERMSDIADLPLMYIEESSTIGDTIVDGPGVIVQFSEEEKARSWTEIAQQRSERGEGTASKVASARNEATAFATALRAGLNVIAPPEVGDEEVCIKGYYPGVQFISNLGGGDDVLGCGVYLSDQTLDTLKSKLENDDLKYVFKQEVNHSYKLSSPPREGRT